MAKALAEELFRNSAYIKSAGIDTYGGESATQEAIQVLEERNINIQEHRSRNIKELKNRQWQVVIAMTPNIKKRLVESKSISTDSLIAWEIPDPFGKGIEAYRECAESIEVRLKELLSTIK
jgi:protein-tyrosine phosphatase